MDKYISDIEKNALLNNIEELQIDLAVWKVNLKAAKQQLQAYQAAFKVLVEAVKYYGDREHWYDGVVNSISCENSAIWDEDVDVGDCSAFQQGGRRARAALSDEAVMKAKEWMNETQI